MSRRSAAALSLVATAAPVLYDRPMSKLLSYLVIGLMIAVLAVLFTGVGAMLRGGEFNRKYGNKLMQWRVMLQFAAVMLMLLFFILHAT